MRSAYLFICLIFAALLLSGCEQPKDVTYDWPEMPGEHKPALWKVSHNGQHGYLFGAVHALPHRLTWLDGAILAALSNSDTLVLEIDPSQEKQPIPDTFRAMGASANIPSVIARIDPQWRDEYAVLADAGDLPDNAFVGRESWAAALSLSGIATRGLGVSQTYGVEAALSEIAYNNKMPIVALESAADQFGYFDRLSEEHQTRMLEAVIADAANAKTSYRALLANWLTGDVEALAKTAQSGMLATGPVRDALLVQRNQAWIAPITRLIDQGQQPFIAVGAAHVAGDDSVQALLIAQGYTVKRVQ